MCARRERKWRVATRALVLSGLPEEFAEALCDNAYAIPNLFALRRLNNVDPLVVPLFRAP